MGFPPGQPPFAQPPFAGSPPFAQSPFQAPIPGGSNLPSRPAFQTPPGMPYQQGPPGANPNVSAAVDDLISSAQAAAAPVPAAAPAASEKKGKEKHVRLVYSDNELSPEEKRAMNPKYAFVPPA